MRASIGTVIDDIAIRCRHERVVEAVAPRPSGTELIASALRYLVAQQVELCFTAQNLGEFWNVSTRPIERNGLALSIDETDAHIQSIERRMTILPEDQRVYLIWRRLLKEHEVRGVQVHDAHLAAVLEVHDVTYLLTFNGPDFKRFKSLTAVHPQQVQP